MLKFKILLIFSFVIIGNTYPQQGWMYQYRGPGNLVSINFINENTGFVFKSNKYFFKSTNGGSTWDSNFINFPLPVVIYGEFYDENIGGIIPAYITSNGGSTWIQSNLPTTNGGSLTSRKISWVDQNTAYICGYEFATSPTGLIHKTTNMGLNWFISYVGGFDFRDVRFLNENTGYICWSSLIKSTNSGLNWEYVSTAFREMFRFSQFFNDTFYIACDSGYVLKTINNGINWMVQTTETHNDFNDIFFLNNQNGYVVGDSGFVFITTNGGMNWVKQNSGTTRKLNEVWFLNKDTGFIAGDSGLLLVTYTGGVTSLSQNYQSIPEKFNLYQNFPNPFNPSTMIRFDVVRNSKVRLSVYDISGKIISTLVDQELTPGSFEYSFSADYLPSGIYFYKLETDNFTETKRMVLVK